MRNQTLARVQDIAVTAAAVVTVLAGLIAALDYMLESKLDAKLEPVKSELAAIRGGLRKMDERYERRLGRLETLHLAPAPPDSLPGSDV